MQDHGDEPFIEAMLWGWQTAMNYARDTSQTPAFRATMLTRAGIMRRQLQDLFARQDALLHHLQDLLVDRQLHGTPRAPQRSDSPDWFALLEKARDNGREYADNGIAAGETAPTESPLSGEWAGAIMPRDVVNMAVGRDDAFDNAKDFEVDDLCDSWEDGYNSAPWPQPLNGGES